MSRVLAVHCYNGAPSSTLSAPERAMNQTPEQIAYRAKLWQEFVAKYQAVLVSSPEKFNEYCEKFRERWIAGK